tara:strand:+ start:104 stop:559 length:456 start_codon:yes stop_codon:yes gene_type:complete
MNYKHQTYLIPQNLISMPNYRHNTFFQRYVMNDIYKILTEDEWNQAFMIGYIETALDKEDGFIHFSTSKQLPLTLELYFKDSKKLILLQVDEEKIKDKIIYERSNSNERAGKFPHLYDKFNIDAVLNKWNITREAFSLPKEILIEAEKNFN